MIAERERVDYGEAFWTAPDLLPRVVNTWQDEDVGHVLASPAATVCGHSVADVVVPGALKPWWVTDCAPRRTCVHCSRRRPEAMAA